MAGVMEEGVKGVAGVATGIVNRCASTARARTRGDEFRAAPVPVLLLSRITARTETTVAALFAANDKLYSQWGKVIEDTSKLTEKAMHWILPEDALKLIQSPPRQYAPEHQPSARQKRRGHDRASSLALLRAAHRLVRDGRRGAGRDHDNSFSVMRPRQRKPRHSSRGFFYARPPSLPEGEVAPCAGLRGAARAGARYSGGSGGSGASCRARARHGSGGARIRGEGPASCGPGTTGKTAPSAPMITDGVARPFSM